jgi:ATP-dependent Clp protease protease subunit
VHIDLKIVLGIGIAGLVAILVFTMRADASAASSEDDRLLGERVVRLSGPIVDANANDVIARLLYLQQLSTTAPIHLLIDSPGGAVSPGLAIVDTMELIKPPVHTHCDGAAGSMALVILTYGHRGERSARPAARLSFALPQVPKDGSATQKADAERFAQILIGKVVQATGIPEADVRRMFEESVTLDGKQSVRIGLVDKIK